MFFLGIFAGGTSGFLFSNSDYLLLKYEITNALEQGPVLGCILSVQRQVVVYDDDDDDKQLFARKMSRGKK